VVNDFEPYLMQLWPPYEDCFELLREHGAVAALHTGSGSGFYGVFEGAGKAETACEALMSASGSELKYCEVVRAL
jgi:4-diphosphocytidyl-2C-methyl-D-erythritol kinase